jgi:type II secretory pathway pseudopilin PulG
VSREKIKKEALRMKTSIQSHHQLSLPSDELASRHAFHLSSVIAHPFRRQKAAFTLLEICIAMSLVLLVIGAAVVSIEGVREEDQLKRAAALIETSARRSMLQAMQTQQIVRMDLTPSAFTDSSEQGGMLMVRRVGESGFRSPKRGESWEFSPSGICEPIELRVASSFGTIELAFDPLTACVRRKSLSQNAKS